MSQRSTTRASRSQRAASYKCAECGWMTAKWVGRCAQCQAWGSVEEVGAVVGRTTAAGHVSVAAQRIGDVDATAAAYLPTGVDELDRVLGGGLVAGAVVLMAGEPGVGKSTLLLDVSARLAERGSDVLYVSGEESAAQVKLRAERIDAIADRLYLTAETDLATALAHVEKLDPRLLVVDSVQTLSSNEVEGVAGGVTQVREVAASLIAAAKKRNMTTLLVGHVTKEGTIAGPRLLEHLVDVVCQFDGERHSRLRLLRATKNRFGPTDEVGCFDLTEDGIEGLPDPSGLFISRTREPVPGTCVTVTLEGRRPLVAEVQALLAPATPGATRRATSGLDSSRVSMLLAVLQQRCGYAVGGDESYVATVGGVRLTEPAADLAVILALASARRDQAVRANMIAFGEVGLAGEVRPVPEITRRVSEAARLGYTHAIVPAGPNGKITAPAGVTVREVASVNEALAVLYPPGSEQCNRCE